VIIYKLFIVTWCIFLNIIIYSVAFHHYYYKLKF